MSQGYVAKIGVVGSAIAGLSAALGVAKAGHHVTIFGPPPTALTGALQLAPNGYQALASLGALDALNPAITRLDAIEIRSARTNSTLSIIDHERPQRRDYGAIGRGALVNGLYQLAKAHPRISFDEASVQSITATQEDTSLITQDTAQHAFDLIIGADGTNGLTRRIIGASQTPAPRDRHALRAACPSSVLPKAFRAKRTQLWLGNGYHLVSYPYFDDSHDDLFINLVLCAPASTQTPAQQVADLTATLPVLSHLSACAIDWHKTPLPPASQLATWRKYGVVLIGDGAHFMPPHLAQGAGQTLEDAAMLGRALTRADDIRQAAANWALSRQRALRPIIEKAEATGQVMRLKGPFAMMRNAAIEFGGSRLIEKWLRQVWQ